MDVALDIFAESVARIVLEPVLLAGRAVDSVTYRATVQSASCTDG